MQSKIGICNQALLFIGTRTIASLEEPTPEAVYCRQFYDQAVLSVLRDHPWGFAQRREKLAAVSIPDGWRNSYTKAYAYPVDCVQAHFLFNHDGSTGQSFARSALSGRSGSGQGSPNFELGADNDRTILLCNLPDAVLAYTAFIRDETRYDPLFTETLARKLQCLLSKPILKGNSQALQQAEQLYARVLSQARLADAKEGAPYARANQPWLDDNPWAAERLRLFRG